MRDVVDSIHTLKIKDLNGKVQDVWHACIRYVDSQQKN